MPDLSQLRQAVSRHIADDGTVINSPLPDGVPMVGTVGEVKSLNPATVELLSGRMVKPRAYAGPIPDVGQIVLMVRVNHWWLAFTGMTVV